MDLNIDGTVFITNMASTTNQVLSQISPVLYLIAGVAFAFFVAYQILDTVAYNRNMRMARETREETDRLLDG